MNVETYAMLISVSKTRTFILRYLDGSFKGEKQAYWMVKNAGISGALMQKENPQQISTQFVTVESIEDDALLHNSFNKLVLFYLILIIF